MDIFNREVREMDTTRAYCEIDGCSSVGIHQVYGKITCNMYQCNQKAKELEKMEQITRELKTGEWINARNLTEPQLNELCKWIINTYEHYPVGEFVINPIIFAISNNELKLFKQDSLRDPSKELTWAQLTERHDQHTDSSDSYVSEEQVKEFYGKNTDDVMAWPELVGDEPNPNDWDMVKEQPYTPQVGEECEFQSFIGNDWIKGVLLASTESYAILKSDEREHSFNKENVGFRPLKTERDLLTEQGCKELTAHFIAAISDRDAEIVSALVSLGWRPTNDN